MPTISVSLADSRAPVIERLKDTRQNGVRAPAQNVEELMLHYRFYLMNDDSHIVGAIDHHASDDASALNSARTHHDDHNIEVWQADRCVGSLKRGEAVQPRANAE